MRALKLAVVSLLIWGLTLLWPEINQVLRVPAMIGLSLALGAISLAYALVQRVHRPHQDPRSGQDHPSHPVPAIATR